MIKSTVKIFTKFATFIDQGIVSGVNFLIGVLLTNFMGIETYGVFAFLWMMVLFVSSIHQAFIIAPIYTLLPKQKDTKVYFANLLGIQLLFSFITFLSVSLIAGILIQFFIPHMELHNGVYVGLIAAVYVLHDFLRRVFFSLKKPFKSLVVDAIGYGLQPIILLVLYSSDALTVMSAIQGVSIVLVLGIVTGFMVYGKIQVSFKIRKTFILHWRFSKFLVGTSLLQWVSGNFFIVMSAGLLGPIAIGVIRMAQNIVGVLHVLFLAFENSIPLQASEVLMAGGKQKMMKFFAKKIKVAFFIVAVILIGIVWFSKVIIVQLYGTQYIDYQYVLYAFCLLYVFVFIGTFLRFIIRTLEYNKIIFYSYIATAIFSLLLAKTFVATFDILGVLLGLIISQLITNGMYLLALKSEIKWLLK
ncbi:MAG: lipopolysaccharide biosynthesis protein [Putridiphycobacter sp.]|nr:lipopolysaccharide biosynthesis protein [Putridiphycobacter sp.]